MANWAFWDWIAYGLIVIAAFVTAIDTAVAQSDELRKYIPRILKVKFVGYVPLVAIVLSASTFAYKQIYPTPLRLPNGAQTGKPQDIIQSWGVNNDVYWMILKTDQIYEQNNLERLVLITRINYANLDRMTDEHLMKSQEFMIQEGFMTIATNGHNKLLITEKNLDKPIPVEFDLVKIPFLFKVDQIKSLSDVVSLGGRIIGSVQLAETFTHPVVPANPEVACPPSPAQPGRT